jgi:hypothetical protein
MPKSKFWTIVLAPVWLLWGVVWAAVALVLAVCAVIEWLLKPSTRYGRGGW